MEDFFKKLSFGKGKKDGKDKTENKSNDKNPLQNLFQPQQQKQPKRIVTGGGVLGTGSSGNSDSWTVETFCFVESGPLGIKVEKSQSNGAIISQVLPNTPASEAGLLRGDVICFHESSGKEQILYDQFLQMIASDQRPISFDVRRIITSSSNKKGNSKDNGEHLSADAYVKRQAMIAAAEARERKFNNKMGKPTSQPKKQPQQTTLQKHQQQPMSEEAKIAVQKAKVSEIQDVQNLGFNPYETATVTAGKAKKTAMDMMHGQIGQWDGHTTIDSSGKASHLLAPSNKNKPLSIYEPFDSAFLSYQSTNPPPTFSASLKIVTKLLHNVISDPNHDKKFRRIRLSNPKIKANVVDVNGAMDVIMLFGFVLVEEEDTCLIYQEDNVVENQIWRREALDYMKNYTVD